MYPREPTVHQHYLRSVSVLRITRLLQLGRWNRDLDSIGPDWIDHTKQEPHSDSATAQDFRCRPREHIAQISIKHLDRVHTRLNY